MLNCIVTIKTEILFTAFSVLSSFDVEHINILVLNKKKTFYDDVCLLISDIMTRPSWPCCFLQKAVTL